MRIAYEHALKIIEKVPLEHEIHTEKEAPLFAERVAADLAQIHYSAFPAHGHGGAGG